MNCFDINESFFEKLTIFNKLFCQIYHKGVKF